MSHLRSSTVSYCPREQMDFAQLSCRWLGCHHVTDLLNLGQVITGVPMQGVGIVNAVSFQGRALALDVKGWKGVK